MKWTKFKDETPNKHFIYITDWNSVWPAFETPNWKAFSRENPKYAWAKIPIPETPVDSDGMHSCDDEQTPKRGFCVETEDGKLLYAWREESTEVNFCPFCGYEAKSKRIV